MLQSSAQEKKLAAKGEAQAKKQKKLVEREPEGTASEVAPVAKRKGRPPGSGAKGPRPPATPKPQEAQPQGKPVTPGKRKAESPSAKEVTPAPKQAKAKKEGVQRKKPETKDAKNGWKVDALYTQSMLSRMSVRT